MSSINHFDLRSFDLNLLVAFDALMETRSVTEAARRLKLGQPAMSHSLSTLRMLLDDALFVRVGPRMVPTARAAALAPQLRETLMQLQSVLRPAHDFDPACEDRVFRLGFSSELELLVVPALTARLRQSASGIRLIGRTVLRADVHAMLDDGVLDVAIGCYEPGVQRHRSRPLFAQRMACCFNPALVDIRAPVTLAAYTALPHVLLTMTDTLQGCLEDALERAGVTLNVVAAGGDFLSVLVTVAAAPVLATIPAAMAECHAQRFGLAVGPVPLDLALPEVAMLWSARLDRDPAGQWLRAQVFECLNIQQQRPAAA